MSLKRSEYAPKKVPNNESFFENKKIAGLFEEIAFLGLTKWVRVFGAASHF